MTRPTSPQPAHTPGPWSARAFPAYGYGITASDSPQARESFAVVHFADTSRGRTTERAKADARLIAAAPELLETLRFLLSVQGADELSDVALEMKADEGDAYYAAVLRSRAAIAKATGAQA